MSDQPAQGVAWPTIGNYEIVLEPGDPGYDQAAAEAAAAAQAEQEQAEAEEPIEVEAEGDEGEGFIEDGPEIIYDDPDLEEDV